VLEAHQRFDLVNGVRIPMGVILFAAPLMVVRYSDDLIPIVATLVAARGLALLAYLAMTRRCQPIRLATRVDLVRTILRLGGWMTVSNLVAPVLLYVDRFVVASVAGLAAVTYYATPFEVISRLSVAPLAVMGVLFPAMSSALVGGRDRARRLYSRSLALIAALLLPPVLAVAVFARPLLTAWLGADFAAHSHLVASLLALGALAHGLAQPSFNLIQAAGRADVTARLHLIEMPLYVLYLWWLTARFGIAGTAAAWLLRVSLSAVVLAALARLTVLARATAEEG
jgi:O-antigen/teichoic acid export membrane protein